MLAVSLFSQTLIRVRRFAVTFGRGRFPRKRIDNRVFNFHRAILTVRIMVSFRRFEMHRKRRAGLKISVQFIT